MSSPASPVLRRHDPFHSHDTYQPYYAGSRLWDRLREPSVLVPIILVLCTVLYQASHGYAATRGRPLPSLLDALWDAIVFATPASLLYAIDNRLNPPLFPIPMLHAQPTTHAAKSDVLRKILGMDKTGGIVASVSQAGRRTLSNSFSGLGFKGDVGKPAGLGNWDNSCYQNSILQGLASLKPLPRYLAGLALQGEAARVPTETAQTLRQLIADLNDSSNNGKTLWTPAVLKNMSTWQQQDAQEYYSKLLDEIDREIAKAARATHRSAGLETDPARDDGAASQHSDDSGYQSLSAISKGGLDLKFVRNPLEGLSAQRVACLACGYSEGLSMIPFNCLTVNLDMNRPEFDLYERLDSYVNVESIHEVQCAKCTLLKIRRLLNIIIDRSRSVSVPDTQLSEPQARLEAVEAALEEDNFDDKTLQACKIRSAQMVKSTKTKQVVIARPPQSLVVHINRSVFDETTGHLFKNSAAVRFPMTLDLGPWCLGSADPLTSRVTSDAGGSNDAADEKAALAALDQEQWLLDPNSSMVAGDQHPSKITGPIYELRAVITHYGRHENGHYVSYRRHPRRPRADEDEKRDSNADQPAQLAANANDDDDVHSVHENEDAGGTLPASPGEAEEPDSQWWRLSDQDVTQVSEEVVLGQGGVFMLFYDCVDPNPVLTSDADAPGKMRDSTSERTSVGAPAAGEEPPSYEEATRAPLAPGTARDEILARAQSVPLPADEDDKDLWE